MTGHDLDPIAGARQAAATSCAEISPIVMWAYLDGAVKGYDALAVKLAAAEQERDAARAQLAAVREAPVRHPHTCGVHPDSDPFSCGWKAAVMDMRATLAAAEQDEPNGNACQRCGIDNPVWFAPNDVWNRVMGGPDATDDPGGFLCPACFIRRAEASGLRATGWELRPEPKREQP